jgi:GNAT superfamily N-acetyltransferase
MIKAAPNDKSLVVELLTRSFEANKSVNYIVRQDNNRKAYLRALMAYSFDVCLLFGEIWLSPDRHACALVLFPDHKRTTLKSIRLDILLIFNAIGIAGISKTLSRESQVRKKQPKIPMVYLWFIGVDPLYQHKGIGSRLLRKVIAHARKQNRPVFLETSMVENLPWYQRFNFHIYDKLELGYTLYFLNNLPV